jgi:hypothetical protein
LLEDFSLKEKPFPFEGKTVSLWIVIYVQYQRINYMHLHMYIFFTILWFHFFLTCMILWDVKHFSIKRNNFPIEWSNGPLLELHRVGYAWAIEWWNGITSDICNSST